MIEEDTQAPAEATVEGSPEAAPQATLEATVEATPEATVEATVEATSDHAVMSLPPEVSSALLDAAKVGLDFGVEALGEAHAKIEKLNTALENCRVLAAKRPKEEWARHILRFCESAGVVASPLRG
jgi:precorrin-6B methylase 1